MPAISLTKGYEEAAEVIKARLLKDGTVTRKQETIYERTFDIIAIEGDIEVLDLSEMDMWRAHLRIELKDFEPIDDEDRATRGNIAMQVPELAAMFTARTIMNVYQRREIVKKTTTIVETFRDGRRIDRKEDTIEEPQEEWEEINREFVRRLNNDYGWK